MSEYKQYREYGKRVIFYELHDVELFKKGKKYAVRYGLQVTSSLTYSEAAKELGICIFHSLQCEGLLDDN